MGAESHEFLSCHAKVPGGGEEIGRLDDVERHNRVDTVSHVVGREACGFADSDPFRPENLGQNGVFIITTGLHDGFAEIEMFGLNNPVSLGVVARDLKIAHIVTFLKILSHCNKGWAIIGH